jgi:hypothetical protein
MKRGISLFPQCSTTEEEEACGNKHTIMGVWESLVVNMRRRHFL